MTTFVGVLLVTGFAAIYRRNVTLRAAVIRGSYYSGLLGHCTAVVCRAADGSVAHYRCRRKSDRVMPGENTPIKLSPSQSAWPCGSSMTVHIHDINHIIVFRVGGLKAAFPRLPVTTALPGPEVPAQTVSNQAAPSLGFEPECVGIIRAAGVRDGHGLGWLYNRRGFELCSYFASAQIGIYGSQRLYSH